jgi:hypothetical protein
MYDTLVKRKGLKNEKDEGKAKSVAARKKEARRRDTSRGHFLVLFPRRE